jgi:hypothetical protein
MATTKKSSKGSSKGSSKSSSKSTKKASRGQATESAELAATGESNLVETHSTDILENLSGGCYTIVGGPMNLEVCYSYDSRTKTVFVVVKLAGQTIGRELLNINRPSYKVCQGQVLVKACVSLTFDISSLCLTFTAQYCVGPITWKCKTYQGRIACFK